MRNAWVRGEHSEEGKSDLSTSRSIPMTDRLARKLRMWRLRTVFGDDEEHEAAKVRVIRFHDLRHTFATTLAAAGGPLRTISEYLGKPAVAEAAHRPREPQPSTDSATRRVPDVARRSCDVGLYHRDARHLRPRRHRPVPSTYAVASARFRTEILR